MPTLAQATINFEQAIKAKDPQDSDFRQLSRLYCTQGAFSGCINTTPGM